MCVVISGLVSVSFQRYRVVKRNSAIHRTVDLITVGKTQMSAVGYLHFDECLLFVRIIGIGFGMRRPLYIMQRGPDVVFLFFELNGIQAEDSLSGTRSLPCCIGEHIPQRQPLGIVRSAAACEKVFGRRVDVHRIVQHMQVFIPVAGLVNDFFLFGRVNIDLIVRLAVIIAVCLNAYRVIECKVNGAVLRPRIFSELTVIDHIESIVEQIGALGVCCERNVNHLSAFGGGRELSGCQCLAEPEIADLSGNHTVSVNRQ